MKPKKPLGWLIQYMDEKLTDDLDGFDGPVTVAEKRDVGHIVRETNDPDWFDVFFERTGLQYTCHVSELTWLGPPETGRKSILQERQVTQVVAHEH